MKKLLLTGFGPFLKNTNNPTEPVVKNLHGKIINNYEIVGRILPVEFHKSGYLLKQYIEETSPDAVISLGLASGRTKITPERIAINCNDGGQPDNAGYIPKGEKIISDGPDGLFSTLPIQEMVANLLEKNIPATISNSAGTYVCNYVMYEALYSIRELALSVPSGFIHVPANHELALSENKHIASMAQTDIEKAIHICIQTLP